MIIKKIVLKTLISILWVVDFLIPKRKDIILISSNGTKSLNGNALSLYNYLKDLNKYQIYTVAKHDKDFVSWKKPKDWFIFLRAKTCIMTHGPADLGQFWKIIYKNNRNLVQLWHGTPIKNMGLLDNGLSKKQKNKIKNRRIKEDFFITCSNIESITFNAINSLPIEHFKVTGFPRNDEIYNRGRLKLLLEEHYPNLIDYQKVVLYAPTWRENGIDAKFFPYSESKNELFDYLKESKTLLLLRGHINDSEKMVSENPWIFPFNSDIEPEINRIMGDLDSIITDYSSIYIDFLLTDKPVAFIPYDIDKYNKVRGLLYNYNSITPGHKIYSNSDFINFLKDLTEERDPYKDIRENCKDFFHRYTDNNSCYRVYNRLIEEGVL